MQAFGIVDLINKLPDIGGCFFKHLVLLEVNLSGGGASSAEVNVHRYQTFVEAQAHWQTFLEEVYNAKRLHSSLGYVSPDEFEVNYLTCSCRGGLDLLGALHYSGSE